MKNEASTRKEIINIRLAQAGWNVDDRTQVIEEFDIEIDKNLQGVSEPISNYRTTHYCDYVLLGKNGEPIAVVEAKSSDKDANVGKEQARQYAVRLYNKYKSRMPYVFYTNGNDIFFWDTENYPPRKVVGFAKREDLERLAFFNENRKPLSHELINTQIAGRPYQIAAIRSVLESIENKKRKFLLVMATGTGKTRTCAALIDILAKANWCQRVLFLVDRIALQEQTINAFKEYLPNLPLYPKQDENVIAKDRRLYVMTYPTMLNILESENNPLSSHFFDLVIIDESHRSIYNTYKGILTYFDSLELGLTATPKDVIDHNTFELFSCESELPTFAYSYEEALNDSFLCDFEVLKLNTRFQIEGVNAKTISLDDQKHLLAEGKDLFEYNFSSEQLEKTVTNIGTNTLIIREFMEESIKDPNGVLPGKTIFFCISKEHARRMEELFDALYPEYKGNLARVIISDDPRVYGKGGLLDQFMHNEFPRIAISVDMLDTGIDVPEIVNLVLAKPVYSYTKFWQMIGRGTRLVNQTNIKPWCLKKDKFLIIDCWNNTDYFQLNPKGRELKPSLALPVQLMKLHIEILRWGLVNNEKENIKIEAQRIKDLINHLPENSIITKENASLLSSVKDESFWKEINSEKADILELQVAPALRAMSGVDFQAMRFEKDALEIILALKQNEKEKSDALIEAVIEKIAELPLNVNKVSECQNIINKALKHSFWETLSLKDVYNVNDDLAPLMKYRQRNQWNQFHVLNLKDQVLIKETVEFGPSNERVGIARYKELVEQTIKELTDKNPVLYKIKKGASINKNEIEELYKNLSEINPYITEDLLRKTYKNKRAHFIQFIKHILGLENLETFNEEVTKAFELFIQAHNNFSSQQIRFLDLLKTYIIEKGSFEKSDLVEAPFTQLHPRGVLGVFSPKETQEIISLTLKLVA